MNKKNYDYTAAERMARKRERDAKMGFRSHQVRCHDDDWQKINDFVTEVNAERHKLIDEE